MNNDFKIIIERIQKNFTRRPRTEYRLQVVNDTYDQTYNFFITIQPKSKRMHLIPLHTVENYDLLYLEQLTDRISKQFHLTISYDGFTGIKWPVKQELIQKRRHIDE